MTGSRRSAEIGCVAAVIAINVAGVWSLGFFLPVTLAVFGVWLLIARSYDPVHFALLFLLMASESLYLPGVIRNLPAVPLLIPLGLSSLAMWLFPRTRGLLSWWRAGVIDRGAALWLLAIGLGSTVALIVWARWTDDLGVGVEMTRSVAGYPRWLVAGIGIPVFAAVNALAEEAVYRGVLMEALDRVFGNRVAVLVLQGSAFAALHFAMGFPNGVVGYGMVLVYGVMLGWLRYRTGGMLAPWGAHVVADLVIGWWMVGEVVS